MRNIKFIYVLRINPGDKGNCQAPLGAGGFQDEYKFGWCFLEHIEDPNNPKKDCYDDLEWSSSEGSFWSRKACRPKATLISIPPPPPPEPQSPGPQ